jgi:hypothetical protein
VIADGLMARALRAPGALLERAQQHYREEKAKATGVAVSRARMIKQLKDILKDWKRPGQPRPPQPTNVTIRMMDGRLMVYFDDGSLRHVMGRSASRAASKKARRALRRERRAA